MPQKFEDLVSEIKVSLRKQYPNLSEKEIDSKAYAMATTKWKKDHGGKLPTEAKSKNWHVIEFLVPIVEKIKNENDEFFIRGIAINETTTRNGIKYIANELLNSASSLRNKPILTDHNNSVYSIIGRTTENVNYSENDKAVVFEGKIMDEKIKEMINDGRIQNVSIGATVQELIEEKEGSARIAKGIEFVELSLVAVPADPNANFGMVIQHAFDLKHAEEEPEEEEKETENQIEPKQEDEQDVQQNQTKLNNEEEKMDEKNEKDLSSNEALSKEIAELKEQVKTLSEKKEQIKSEIVTETKQENSNTEGYVTERHGNTASLITTKRYGFLGDK